MISLSEVNQIDKRGTISTSNITMGTVLKLMVLKFKSLKNYQIFHI